MNGILKYGQVEEQRVFPNKQNRMKNMRSKSMSNPYDNTYTGLMNNPSFHHSTFSSSFYYHQQNQLPPLLPLPTISSQSAKNTRKNSSREMSNYKPPQTVREEVKKKPTQSTPKFLTTSSFRSTAMAGNGFGFEMMDSASWVFNLSPPPSSLPVPKFCVRRSKLSCNAENN